MRTIRRATGEGSGARGALPSALARLAARLGERTPRRLRRWVERVERAPRSAGHRFCSVSLVAVTIYALGTGGALRDFGDALLVGAGFGIGEISFQGAKEIPELTLLMALETDGRAMLLFDAAAARSRVAALPWVKSVSVRKLYPGTLKVVLEEREAFALWQNEGRTLVIDRAGGVIVPLSSARFAKLPLVVGSRANERAEEFVALLDAAPALRPRIMAGVLVAGRRWDLRLSDDVVVKLPAEAPAAALAALAALDARERLFERGIAGVDLRLSDKAAIRLRPEAAALLAKDWEGRMKNFKKAEAAL